MASSASKEKKTKRIGIRRPPPPIPPAFEIADPMKIIESPNISYLARGNKGLCTHLCFLPQTLRNGHSSFLWQTKS